MRLSESEAKGVAEHLRRLLYTAEDGLNASDVESVASLIDAGEYAVALETLCTQIYEYDVEVDSHLHEDLVHVGNILGVPAAYLLGDPWAESPR
jgi:hypothetical protein